MLAAATVSSRRHELKNSQLDKDSTPMSPSYLDDPNSLALQNISFTKKLFDMLSDPNNRDIITWNRDGLSFEVLDPKALERDVLPRYFRHSRFQSLVRQLNFYNFKKVGKERSSWIYTHEYFQRGKPDLLESLKRKTNTSAFIPTDSNYAYRISVRTSSRNPRLSRDGSAPKRSDSISAESDVQKESDESDVDGTSGESDEVSCHTPLPIEQKKLPKIHITLGSPTSELSIWNPLITPKRTDDDIEHFLGEEASELCFSALLQRIEAVQASDNADINLKPQYISKCDVLERIQTIAFDNRLTLNFMLDLLMLLMNLKDLLNISTFHARNKKLALERLESRILEHLHTRHMLSWEVLQYMEALHYPIHSLPFFKSKVEGNQTESLKQELNLNELQMIVDHDEAEHCVPSVFEGKLSTDQIHVIVTHFLRLSLNLLRNIYDAFSEDQTHCSCMEGEEEDGSAVVNIFHLLHEMNECEQSLVSFYGELVTV